MFTPDIVLRLSQTSVLELGKNRATWLTPHFRASECKISVLEKNQFKVSHQRLTTKISTWKELASNYVFRSKLLIERNTLPFVNVFLMFYPLNYGIHDRIPSNIIIVAQSTNRKKMNFSCLNENKSVTGWKECPGPFFIYFKKKNIYTYRNIYVTSFFHITFLRCKDIDCMNLLKKEKINEF